MWFIGQLVALAVLGKITLKLVIYCRRVVKYRAFSYGYNPKLDYKYEFNPDYAEVAILNLKDNRLTLLSTPHTFNTAFVEINICSSWYNFLLPSEIKMKAEGLSVFQDFECRAKGIRYLNISSLVQKGIKEVQFEFRGCKPKTSSVKLITYKNQNPEKERILILSPHPDDAEIAAYGFYSSNPENTFVATITGGEAGEMYLDGLFPNATKHAIQKGKIRSWNSISVPQLGGIAPENCINLGYFDGSLQKMYDDPKALVRSKLINTIDINLFRSKNCSHLPDSLKPESNWLSLLDDLKYLILKVKPTIIVSPYPALDRHFDHKFTTVALIQAMKEIGYKDCQVWLYTNHFILTEMYPDGRQGGTISLPPYFDDKPIYFDRLYSFPLSETHQAEKSLVLDSFNDLRNNTKFSNTKTSWHDIWKEFRVKLYLKELDYFRRAVRSNELFFVIEGENLLHEEKYQEIVGNLAP